MARTWQRQKKTIFSLKFLCASHLKIKHFELPPANEMEDMKTKLTEMHTRCPILAIGCCWLSVILQISNFEAILYLGHFFIHSVVYTFYTITSVFFQVQINSQSFSSV